MSNVYDLELKTFGDDQHVPARAIIKRAKKLKLSNAIFLGLELDGTLAISSSLNTAQTLFLIEKAKEYLLSKKSGRCVV